MPCERERLVSALYVPHLRPVIGAAAACREPRAVRVELDRVDVASMPLERHEIEVAKPVPVAPLESPPAVAPRLRQQFPDTADVGGLPVGLNQVYLGGIGVVAGLGGAPVGEPFGAPGALCLLA